MKLVWMTIAFVSILLFGLVLYNSGFDKGQIAGHNDNTLGSANNIICKRIK